MDDVDRELRGIVDTFNGPRIGDLTDEPTRTFWSALASAAAGDLDDLAAALFDPETRRRRAGDLLLRTRAVVALIDRTLDAEAARLDGNSAAGPRQGLSEGNDHHE